MTRLQQTRVGRTTVRIRPAARGGGVVTCRIRCRQDYPKNRSALIQCYRTCKERNTGRAPNGGITGPADAVRYGPECQPAWPDLPPGASLTIDPSRPPPTTQQVPFCDWPSSSCLADVQSYPPVQATAPPQPRLSNAARRRRGRLVRPRGTPPTTRVAPDPSSRACDGETCAKCGGTCTWVEDNGKSKMICYDWWTGTSKQTCHNRMRPGSRPRAVRMRNPPGDLVCKAGGELKCSPQGDNTWKCVCERCTSSHGVTSCITYGPSTEGSAPGGPHVTAPSRPSPRPRAVRRRAQRLRTAKALRCGDVCTNGCLTGCQIKHCGSPGWEGCDTQGVKKGIHCAAACITASGGSQGGSAPQVFGRRVGSKMRPRSNDCDETCIFTCGEACEKLYPNLADQVVCMSGCIKAAEQDEGRPPPRGRRSNQGVRFATAAREIAQLTGRRIS